jgi:hypothetical protein
LAQWRAHPGFSKPATGPQLGIQDVDSILAAPTTRDAAIAYIHSIPAPPVAGAGRVHANASGAPVASGWGTTMPNLLPVLDDEIQAIKGTRSMNPTFSKGIRAFLTAVRVQDQATEAAINKFWPPLPADG